MSTKDAATWSADEDGDGIADRLADADATDEPQYDETLEPDWFNPYRAS